MHITMEWGAIIALTVAVISGLGWAATNVYKLTHSSSTHNATVVTDIKYIKKAINGLTNSVNVKLDKIEGQIASHETRITLLESCATKFNKEGN